MRSSERQVLLSASDLANHLGCRHLTALDLATLAGELSPPVWNNAALEVLQERGFQHEGEYLDHLRSGGVSVVDVAVGDQGGSATDATLDAMRSGADVITQATLTSGRWFGRADVLRRVPLQSSLGDWSYEVTDTKLARETKAGTILQLCLYSDIVGELQGRVPDFMHVVAPGCGYQPETFRLRDYLAYYRLIKARLRAVVDGPSAASAGTYPEPVPKCDSCRWWPTCDKKRRDDDHLSLVAGISKLQREEVSARGVATLADLAQLRVPLDPRPRRGSQEGYARVREQARVQLEGRNAGVPVRELLPLESKRGLARLPTPSPGDVFFDIEGDPFVGVSGLEYLFGWVVHGEGGSEPYHARWAFDASAERKMFEAFVDEVMARWGQHPDMHVFHYAPYEPSAMKRLMGRYATRQDEIDRMLRAGLFVDLYSVTKQTLRASIERYSIKELEQFYGFDRDVELRAASQNLRSLERALELGGTEDIAADVRTAVEGYNRDDCVSTLRLRNWLEGLRQEVIAGGDEVPRPELGDGTPSEIVDERQQRVLELMSRLLRELADEREQRSPDEHARWLLAHMLDWHRREAKAPWWEYFRLAALGDEELLDERAAVSGLRFVGDRPPERPLETSGGGWRARARCGA